MAVGMAMAEAHMAAIFNKEGFNVVDNYTYVLMGDGCMMEGASYEAASLAGTQKLNKLIAIYDSNRITIEGSTDIAFTENVAARFGSMGWQVINVENGEDIVAISLALEEARIEAEKPSLIIVHTDIAHGTLKEGSAGAHGLPLAMMLLRTCASALAGRIRRLIFPRTYMLTLRRCPCAGRAHAKNMKKCMQAMPKHIPSLPRSLSPGARAK